MRGSRLVFGSADLKDDDVTGRLLDQFYEAGGRSLDVANVYANGESERAVGKWLAARGVRDDLVLYGKGCHPPYCSPPLVAEEVDNALALLGVDYLEVFMLHRDDSEVPVELFADALLESHLPGRVATRLLRARVRRYLPPLSANGTAAGSRTPPRHRARRLPRQRTPR
jgi:aryl-alcohol dehydrogenase-like predicted oxidoreductase